MEPGGWRWAHSVRPRAGAKMVTTWSGVSIPKLDFLLSSADMAIWCYLIHSESWESWQDYHLNTVPKTPFLCLFRGFVIAVDFDKIWDCWRMGMGMYETAWNSSFLLWTPGTHLWADHLAFNISMVSTIEKHLAFTIHWFFMIFCYPGLRHSYGMLWVKACQNPKIDGYLDVHPVGSTSQEQLEMRSLIAAVQQVPWGWKDGRLVVCPDTGNMF